MNLFYELTFFLSKLAMAAMAGTTILAIGMVFYERYVEGNVDAFKPERRVGPADRRAEISSH